MPDELLTVSEVAERLKLNPQTVRNWIDRRELAAVRLGSRRVRVRSSELDRFIAASTSAQEPDEAAARVAFSEALSAVETAETDEDLVPRLKRLSRAAETLARALR